MYLDGPGGPIVEQIARKTPNIFTYSICNSILPFEGCILLEYVYKSFYHCEIVPVTYSLYFFAHLIYKYQNIFWFFWSQSLLLYNVWDLVYIYVRFIFVFVCYLFYSQLNCIRKLCLLLTNRLLVFFFILKFMLHFRVEFLFYFLFDIVRYTKDDFYFFLFIEVELIFFILYVIKWIENKLQWFFVA